MQPWCRGALFPALARDPSDNGGENPPLHRIAWLHLIFKGHYYARFMGGLKSAPLLKAASASRSARPLS
jgi:hypothetical protein